MKEKNYTNWFEEYYKDPDQIKSKDVEKLEEKIYYDIDNFNMYIDVPAGAKAVKFIEIMNQLKLTLWQKNTIFLFFGCVIDLDFKGEKITTRFYKELFLEIARGNGKTPLAAAIMSYKWMIDKEVNSQFYGMANTKNQAGLLFNELNKIVNLPFYEQGGFKSQGRGDSSKIIQEEDVNFDCRIQAYSPQNLDGLNYSIAVVDEVHEMQDLTTFDTLVQGKKHYNACLVIITTAGQIDDGVYDFYSDRSEMIFRDFSVAKEDRLLPVRYRIDDPSKWDVETEIMKANPSWNEKYFIGSKEEIMNKIQQIKHTPSLKANYFRKRLNWKVTGNTSFYDYEMFDYDHSYDEEEMLKKYSRNRWFIGIDLAEWEDLSSVVMFTRDGDDNMILISKSFISRRGYNKHKAKGILPMKKYVEQGNLIIAGDHNTDHNKIFDYILAWESKLNIQFVCYDPAYADYLVERFGEELGWYEKSYLTKGSSTAVSISPQMKKTKEALIAKKVFYNNNFFETNLLNIGYKEIVKGSTILFEADNKNKAKLHDEASAWYYALLGEYRYKKTILKII